MSTSIPSPWRLVNPGGLMAPAIQIARHAARRTQFSTRPSYFFGNFHVRRFPRAQYPASGSPTSNTPHHTYRVTMPAVDPTTIIATDHSHSPIKHAVAAFNPAGAFFGNSRCNSTPPHPPAEISIATTVAISDSDRAKPSG